MRTRLSLRKLFLSLIGVGGLFLLLANVRQSWSKWNKENLQDQENKILTAVPSTHATILTTTASKRNSFIKLPPEPPPPSLRQWFFAGGKVQPSKPSKKLFQSAKEQDDRIIDQLMHIPEGYSASSDIKSILVFNGLATWAPAQPGETTFANCPVNKCRLTADRSEASTADAILFKDQVGIPPGPRPMKQIWILYFLECPYHTSLISVASSFNWTATYRTDSTLVAPYERWAYYDNSVKQRVQERNYAANKTRKVAWFVSNCGARNERMSYAKELQKYIQVDIYGSCGPLKCSRSNTNRCFDLLDKEYKFYLAFENSNCKDYITEKFYVNGLQNNVLPIVMGARPQDYQRTAPQKSYIHVDEFNSPKDLAEYLHRLDANDPLYNTYFRWKGTGEFINTYFWCRLCTLLHTKHSPHHYDDINDWWRGQGVCTQGSWREKTRE